MQVLISPYLAVESPPLPCPYQPPPRECVNSELRPSRLPPSAPPSAQLGHSLPAASSTRTSSTCPPPSWRWCTSSPDPCCSRGRGGGARRKRDRRKTSVSEFLQALAVQHRCFPSSLLTCLASSFSNMVFFVFIVRITSFCSDIMEDIVCLALRNSALISST